MTKTRSTKSALVSSVVAMFLCFTMLMGTTFAWFTDSVTSSGNVIETGTLKVDLEVLGTDNTTWTSVKDTNDSIFNYTNWEPGFVQTKILRVENEGSLALKWKARLESETALSALAGVIDVYVLAWGVLEDTSAVVYPTDRDLDGFTKVGTLTDFINTVETTTTGVLEAGEKAYLAIAFKMQDTAGNEYQDMTLGEYDLKILATQFTSEDDSFDNQYDADLEIGENGVSRILEDGSTAFFYNEESGLGGKVRLIALPDDVGSEYTVNSVVNDLGGALAGVTLDKLTIHSGVENAYKSLDGATIREVILEEGTVKVPNRMFYKANVENIVIPSTVTVIEENAFAMSGPQTLVIPSSVTHVGEAAFQHMPNLTTVTFEGNTEIEGYAFRGCADLRTVYLNGDDVTFITSATGKNSCWFCNGESNNSGTSNITFYVKNAAVAAKLRAALGSEKPETTPIYIDEQLFVNVKSATELQSALNNAVQDTLINFVADINGDVTVTQKANVNLIINGNGFKFTGVMSVFGNGRQQGAETLIIKNINFVAKAGAESCIYSPDRDINNAYSYSHNVTVEDCTFTDPDGVVNCAAIRHGDGGDNDWTVRNCKVDSTMHSILQINNVNGRLVIEKCEVYSKNGANLNCCTNVEINNCDFDVLGYAVRFGVNSGGNLGEAKTFVINDSNLTSANDDGDAVIIFRNSAVDAVLSLNNTTLVGTPDISGSTDATVIYR